MFEPSVFIVLRDFRLAVFRFCGKVAVAGNAFLCEFVCLILLANAVVEVFLQGCFPFLQLLFGYPGVNEFRKLAEDVHCGGQETASVVYPTRDEPFVLPDKGRPIRVVKGLCMADIGDGETQGAGHGVEFIIISSEVLVRPSVGIAMAGNADAVEVAGRECGIHYPVGVFAVRDGVEPVHLTVFAPGGFGHWVTGDEVEDGVYAKELGLWFEYVHGLAYVVAVRCGYIFVDLEDDAVVIHVLR